MDFQMDFPYGFPEVGFIFWIEIVAKFLFCFS